MFLLVDLMVGIAVLGILATLAIPSSIDRIVQTQTSEAPQLARLLEDVVVDQYQLSCPPPIGHGSACLLPDSVTGIGNGAGEYVSSISITNGGVIKTIFGSTANKAIQGLELDMVPAVDGVGNITWLCGYKAAPAWLTVSAVSVNNTNVPAQYLSWTCR